MWSPTHVRVTGVVSYTLCFSAVIIIINEFV